jgi:hypothetical protein
MSRRTVNGIEGKLHRDLEEQSYQKIYGNLARMAPRSNLWGVKNLLIEQTLLLGGRGQEAAMFSPFKLP